MEFKSRKYIFSSVLLLFAGIASAQAPDRQAVIAGAERAFDKAAKAVKMPAPGCSVGVSLNGESVFEKAFGLAEMEHGIANTPQTIFESGSVAKHFTAAALVLLQQDRKLSLDDPVRKYIPELPDYGSPMTIRHLLNHTAGLRDWGSVMALTGAGRGDRVISQDLAIDVILRQKSLDFVPGAEYSYSNSGYQLAALIVERVSKQKFPAFIEQRLFKPLGMKNSSWRDDYQRIVPGRAQAYSRNGNDAPWQLNMPFMNVYGNGGMLTTVGDWLKWNAMLDSRSMGAPLVEALETQGILNDGRKISYALGLVVDDYKGIKDVSHGGSTAGYQTFLARYPEKKLSVAVLCNGTSPSAGGLGASVTDEIFGPFPAPAKVETVAVAEDELRKYEGSWQNDVTRFVNPITLEKGELRLAGSALKPIAGGAFLIGERKLTFTDANKARIQNPDGSATLLTRVADWKPTAADLAEFAGEWYSEESQAAFTFVIEGDKAFIRQRPTTSLPLRPVTKDHFSTPGYVVWVTRDKSGKIEKLHIGGSRMRDMPFVRVGR
ncbi:MAG: beta-lactamase family protein [Acidobacteria bacterium]|nr:beta-lactamase family protein [Acidobacteriota bacterium]